MNENKKDIKNYTSEELKFFLHKDKFPKFYAKQIFIWIYQKRVEDFNLMTDLSKENRDILKEAFYFSNLELLKEETSSDGTKKFLFGLEDGLSIETVFIPEARRATLCISTQVGCKFKCGFCMSGQKGFKRDLRVSEIINQYLFVADKISPNKITNIVFMGIGEPLDNFENTTKTVRILTNQRGICLGAKRISISTCGLVPEIYQLAELDLKIKLSVSLHAVNNNIRSRLMPVNKKYPLEVLIPAIEEFSKISKHAVIIEYVLIKDKNTKKEDAGKLAELIEKIGAKLNILVYNGHSQEFLPPKQEEIDNFKKELNKKGIFFTLRKSRGQDINAACGQLRSIME